MVRVTEHGRLYHALDVRLYHALDVRLYHALDVCPVNVPILQVAYNA